MDSHRVHPAKRRHVRIRKASNHIARKAGRHSPLRLSRVRTVDHRSLVRRKAGAGRSNTVAGHNRKVADPLARRVRKRVVTMATVHRRSLMAIVKAGTNGISPAPPRGAAVFSGGVSGDVDPGVRYKQALSFVALMTNLCRTL